jgi:choice-of-anchor A domain-containing protein
VGFLVFKELCVLMNSRERFMSDRFKGREWRSTLSWFIASGVVGATSLMGGGAHADNISWQQFDLVTLGNFQSSSDVEGSSLIAGNTSGTWNSSIHQNVTPPAVTVILGGSQSGTLNMDGGGSLLVSSAGDVTGTVNFNDGGTGKGSLIVDPTTVTSDISTVTSQLHAASAAYAALPTDTSINTVTFGSNTATFTAGGANANGVAVFTVSASELASVGQFDLASVASGVTSIVINVTGSGSFSFSGNFIGSFGNFESTTLWNFSTNIDSITTNSAWDGAFMALGASVTTNQDFNGAVFVDNLSTQSEVHLPLFDGFIPAPSVPEPSSIALLSVSTIFGLGYLIRRRRAEARPVLS